MQESFRTMKATENVVFYILTFQVETQPLILTFFKFSIGPAHTKSLKVNAKSLNDWRKHFNYSLKNYLATFFNGLNLNFIRSISCLFPILKINTDKKTSLACLFRFSIDFLHLTRLIIGKQSTEILNAFWWKVF